MRRDQLALLAWAESFGPTPVVDPITVIHFGSSLGLSPAPAPPTDFRPQDAEDWIPFLYSLSPEHYLAVACFLGWVDEIYWVQPEISMFSGPSQDASFEIRSDGGQLTFVRKDSSSQKDSSDRDDGRELTERRAAVAAGQPDRLLPIAVAHAAPETVWKPGAVRLHALSLDQLDAFVEQEQFEEQPVWVDVDLDYFGARTPLRLHGPLLLHEGADVATGIDGDVLPVFKVSDESRRDLVRRVGSVVTALRPWRTAMIESPDHVFRSDLPELATEVRRVLRGRSSAAESEVRVSRVDAEIGGRRIELDPGRTRSLVAPSEGDSLRLDLFLAEPLEESLHMSLYFDPRNSRDQRLALWRFDPGSPEYGVTVPFPRDGRAFQPGWDVEIRTARTGRLLYSAEFVVLGETEPFRRSVDAFFSELPPDTELAAPQTQAEIDLNEWVRLGAVHGVPIRVVEDLIFSLPQSYRLHDASLDRHLMKTVPVPR